jgi:hypothetical protein
LSEEIVVVKPAHTRVTFEGVIGTAVAPVENWALNINFPASVTGAAATDAALGALAQDASTAWNNSLSPIMGSDVVLNKVRVASVDDTGHVHQRADGTYVQADNGSVWAGAMAKQPVPLQTALCVSLTTLRPGPTGKGRFFLPWPALSLDADDKRIPIAQVNGVIDNIKAFLQALATEFGQDPIVVSSKGYTSAVTGLKVGRVPDTMRSRREDSPEGYITAALHP